MSTIEERVARGAAWLDKNEPDWVARIDLNRLLLSSPCRCVLGQIYGHYSDAPDNAVIEGRDEDWGFNLDLSEFSDYRERDAGWRALTAEWRRVITERRAAS